MAKPWEEDFWFITAIMNNVFGLYLIFRKLFSSWFPLPILATVAAALLYHVHVFSDAYRHETYFKNKPKIMQSILLELFIVTLSISIFSHLGYKRVVLFAWLVYGVPAFVATFRKPCRIPEVLPVSGDYNPILYITGFVVWGFWYGKDEEDHMSQVVIGLQLIGQSSHLLAYHLYMEADRHMKETEYYKWLMRQIRQGAVGRSQMLVDLFLARRVYV